MPNRASSPVALALAVAGITIVVACNEGGPPPAAPIVVSVADAAVDANRGHDAEAPPISTAGDAGAAGTGADAALPDFYACADDSECVAVPKVGCCLNGYKEAVSKASAEAYKLSFTCPNPNQMCPQILVNDARIAECSNETHKCEMVEIQEIRCNGLLRTSHKCPDGYRCVLPKKPDLPGKCVK
jgi:hypothetical protein